MGKLENLFDDYYFLSADGTGPGSLLLESEEGDTLIPPYQGRFSILEEASSYDDAYDAAKAWRSQS